ncbi:hypothetical protein H5U35_08975 [Candidatus Aerophobetes bacterium]|nr:hypothetical protein [Candidatus Aerophobetes bacterium]
MSLSKLLVHVEVGSQVMVVALQPFLRMQRGEVIPLWFFLDNMVIFDPVTERAIF